MKLTDLFDLVEADEDLEGVDFGPDGVIIRCLTTKQKTQIGLDAVENSDWGVLRDVLVGKREPQALRHMTRVVGYYSMTDNWSKSKIGELKDRIRGSYSLEGDHESREERLKTAEAM